MSGLTILSPCIGPADTSGDLRGRSAAVDANELNTKPVALQELISWTGRVLSSSSTAGVMLD